MVPYCLQGRTETIGASVGVSLSILLQTNANGPRHGGAGCLFGPSPSFGPSQPMAGCAAFRAATGAISVTDVGVVSLKCRLEPAAALSGCPALCPSCYIGQPHSWAGLPAAKAVLMICIISAGVTGAGDPALRCAKAKAYLYLSRDTTMEVHTLQWRCMFIVHRKLAALLNR